MVIVKAVKTKAYFKRYQVKFRRRREGKTDYYARKRLVNQAKNKYNAPKYRLVVRITNKDVIAQIVSSKIEGDRVLAAAYSHELPRYGINVGLTNWPAAYATGLLLARRVLKKLGLEEMYPGQEEADGTHTTVEPMQDGPRPFKVALDIGLARATRGARVFGVLKGASDGGLNVPHSPKRFPGYDAEKDSLDSDILRSYIFGGHVADYMRKMKEENEEKYQAHFAQFIKAGIDADGVEDIYSSAHEAIRANPNLAAEKKTEDGAQAKITIKPRTKALNLKQRKERVRAKKAKFFSTLA